jgi:LAO/AO transport system kinase
LPADSDLAARVLAGDARAVARAISLVEDEDPEGADLIRRIYPETGKAYLVGITGPPGAGKSTLVDRLTTKIRSGGQTVGVIAVDPTSPFTGGAILGDRVRMGIHAADHGVFIRSMATRGHLGGLARATTDVALVLDAAGKDVVIIETIGVGQDEVEIVRTADVSIVMLVPGTGDEVQALKAGLMEIADIFVVNKADREGADPLVQSIRGMLSLQTFAPGDWRPPILKTQATADVGTSELWTEIQRFREHSPDARVKRQRARQEHRLRELLSQRYLEQVDQVLPPGELARVVDRIASRDIDPYSATTDIMTRVVDARRAGPADPDTRRAGPADPPKR